MKQITPLRGRQRDMALSCCYRGFSKRNPPIENQRLRINLVFHERPYHFSKLLVLLQYEEQRQTTTPDDTTRHTQH